MPNVYFDSYLGCLDVDRFIYIAGVSSHVTVIKILQKSLSNDETYLDWIGLDPFQVCLEEPLFSITLMILFQVSASLM